MCVLFEIMENGQRILQTFIPISSKCHQLQGEFVPLNAWPGPLLKFFQVIIELFNFTMNRTDR